MFDWLELDLDLSINVFNTRFLNLCNTELCSLLALRNTDVNGLNEFYSSFLSTKKNKT